MKNLLIIVGFVIVALSFNSCKKDFLNIESEGTQDFKSYFLRPEEVDEAVTGVYAVLQYNGVHGVADWVYGDVMSDDTEKGGSDNSDQPAMRELETFTYSAGNALVSKTWSELYVGITRANLVLARINDVPKENIENGYRERLRAETKFLRAYFYFRLNIMFGGVPLITNMLTSKEFEQARATKEEVWAQIEKDLTEAIPYLPKKNVSDSTKKYDPTTDMGRATVGAANALLCKVYLYQGEWALAKNQAEVVINSGEYDLTELNVATPLFDNIFDLEHENNIESIFEVQCGSGFPGDENNGGDWGNGTNGTLMNIFWFTRALGGWGFNNPTKDLKFEYEKFGAKDDLRYLATIAKSGDKLLYGLSAYNTKHSASKMCPRKYIVPIEGQKSETDGPSNFRIIRYADVLLMHAEASAQLGDNTAAEADLMLIRKRVKISTMADDAKFPTMLDKIYHERRVELALEGQRFFDLVRWGLAEKYLAPLGYTSKNAVFPIPVGDIQLSGGKIIQNPGY